MKYEKCLRCNQLGTNCDGPNLLLLDDIELGQWLNELRKIRGLTYDKSAAETQVSKTALYNFLTGAHPNCRLDTVRPLAQKFIGSDCDDNPCGNVTNSEKAAYEERIHQLEAEIAWRDDKIKHLTDNYNSMTMLIANTNKRHDEENKRHEDESQSLHKLLDERYKFLKRKDKVIVILSVLLGLSVAAIIAALIIDRLNSDIGFFWLESVLKPHGINEILQQWRT